MWIQYRCMKWKKTIQRKSKVKKYYINLNLIFILKSIQTSKLFLFAKRGPMEGNSGTFCIKM